MLPRHLAVLLHRGIHAGGALLLQGPRGAGKSTLLRHELPRHLYLDLTDATDRSASRRDPAAFLARLRRPAIIDELQRSPELVSHLAAHPLDQPVVFAADLRLPLPLPTFELHPLTRAERQRRPAMPLSLLGRFTPAPASPRRTLSTDEPSPPSLDFLWRDLPLLLRPHDLDRFERFFSLLAQRSGTLLAQQELARELDVSHRTIVRWLQALDACFLTLRLEPFDEPLSRRLVRRPKLHLLGSTTSFETEVVTELHRNARHAGLTPQLRYWRDSNGLEIPLIVQAEPGDPWIPCALAPRADPAAEARLHRWMRLSGLTRGALIQRAPTPGAARATPILRYALSDL